MSLPKVDLWSGVLPANRQAQPAPLPTRRENSQYLWTGLLFVETLFEKKK
jgi:hypothetical protein